MWTCLFLLEHKDNQRAFAEGVAALVDLGAPPVRTFLVQFNDIRCWMNTRVSQGSGEAYGITFDLDSSPWPDCGFRVDAYRFRFQVRVQVPTRGIRKVLSVAVQT
jgi:hypothetical protein